MEKEELNKNIPKKTFLERAKIIILNKFYIELAIYLLILNIGFGVELVSKNTTSLKNLQIIYSFINSVVVAVLLYVFGYIVAMKRKDSNKFFPSVGIFFVTLILYGISSIFENITSEAMIVQYFKDIYAFIVSIHFYSFSWINIVIKPPLFIYFFIASFFTYRGSRRNYKREKRKTEELQKRMEKTDITL